MFKNPLKYQSGGSTPTQQQQDQLVQLFQAAAQNAQVDPEALVKKAQELGQDENAAAQFMEGLQRCAQGDPAGIQFIKSLFTPSHKRGGKIQDFICKHARGGQVAGCGCEKPVLKGQEAIPGGMPRFEVVRDTTYTNPANRRIMEQVIVGPDGQAYRRTTENGINPIVIGGYWDGQFTPEGDNAIPVQRFDSLFRRAIPKQKTQSNQNIVKNQNPAGPMPDTGTISQGKPRSKVSQAIDNNSKARNFVKGVKQFVKSPMVKWPLAGALAYGGYRLGLTPTVQSMGDELAPHMAPYLFPFLSQMRPKFILDTMNPMEESPKIEKLSDVFWAVPSNEKGGKIKNQKNK